MNRTGLLIALTCLIAAGGGAAYWATHLRDRRPPDLRLCEAVIQYVIKAPSTYKRASYFNHQVDGAPAVSVSFDAANSYGAPIRTSATCVTDLTRGNAIAPGFPTLKLVTIDGKAIEDLHLIEIIASGRVAGY